MEGTQKTGGKVDFAAVNSIDAARVYEYISGRSYPNSGHINCPRCGSRDNVSINKKTNHFHCFGCCGDGRGELSNIDYTAAALDCTAVDAAAALHNYFFVEGNGKTPPPIWTPAKADAETYTKKQDAEVNGFILECLRNSDGDSGLIEYLAKRGFTRDICRLFDVYTISQTDYYKINTKLKKEFTPERLEGLPVISGKGNFAFWGAYRIIFSIKDARGRLQGFKARAIPLSKEESDGRKYRNAAPRNGYNLTAAVNPPNKRLYIVEGELDAIAAAVLGLSAVSFGGLTGTAAGDMLTRLLSYSEKQGVKISVCYDSDSHGQTAQAQFIEIAKNFPNLTVTGENIKDYAREYLPHYTPAEIDSVKDFADILRGLNGDKMTDSQRESNVKTAERYCTEGKHDINQIAEISNNYPFEIRRGFMDLIALYGCKFLTFSNDYQYINVNY